MSLNKHQIFAANDLKEAFVDVPEWGGKVKIKALSVQEQLDYDAFLAKKPAEIDMALHLIITACIDDNGGKLFNLEDCEMLKKKNAANLFRIVEKILDLNKQNSGQVEELAKN